MASEVSTPLNYRRSSTSQFTATTYPGGLSEVYQRDSISRFLLLPLRRRGCLAFSILPLLVVFVFFQSTLSTSFEGLSLGPPRPAVLASTGNVPEAIKPATVLQNIQENMITDQSESEEPVVFVLIMWSKSSAREGAVLIKSILMYNSKPSEFHIICDDEAEEFLRSRFTLVRRPRQDIIVKFYKPSWQSMLDRIEREGTIATDHSAGLPGLMKLFIHEIVSVQKGIYLDTDSFFISDPALLWNVFGALKPSTAIVMPSHPDQISPQWNHASRICSCVMLLQLDKLRSQRLMDSSIYELDSNGRFSSAIGSQAFRAMYGLPGGDGRGRYNNVRLGDQGYWWAIVSHRPDLFEPLSYDFEVSSCLLNTYNIGLGDDGVDASLELSRQTFLAGTPQESTVVLPKLLHFNCLHGTDVYMDWEGWTNPDDILNQRWGAALKYHNGYKWIWLNNGGASLRMHTADVLFADEQSARRITQ